MEHIKGECRKKLRKLILEIDSCSMNTKSAEINKRLVDLLLQRKFIHLLIGGYYPLKSEVDYLCRDINFSLAFPIMTDGELVFKKAKIKDLVERRAYGQTFLEPREEAEIVSPEVLIIPGLGFTSTGERIGKGKGFYDKYLKKSKVVKIGICFHEQLVDEIPTDNNDISMDFIITDKVLVEI